MIRHVILFPYRAWLRLDLRWIRDCIADAEARHARHELTMRSLRSEEARLLAKIEPVKTRYGLAALRPRKEQT